MKKEPN